MQLLSVIVPVYNVEKQLPHCIETICNQTYHNLEIILVDDGSTDTSGKICDEFSEKDQRIKVIHKKNGGQSSARNVGLDIASGEYYSFVDSDDYIELDMYEKLISCLEEYPNADIACAGIIREKENGQNAQIIRSPKTQTIYQWQEALTEILRSRNMGSSVWSKVYKKSVFENIRFPLGQTNEDVHILAELHRNRIVVHSGLPLYHYVIRDGSTTSKYSSQGAEWILKNVQKIRNYLSGENDELNQSIAEYEAVCMYSILISYYSQDNIQDKNIPAYFQAFKQTWFRLMLSQDCTLTTKIKCLLLRTHTYKYLWKVIHRIKAARYGA